MNERVWTIRRTDERERLIEALRALLKSSGREVETIHGTVTTAAIFDEALRALEKELEQEGQPQST